MKFTEVIHLYYRVIAVALLIVSLWLIGFSIGCSTLKKALPLIGLGFDVAICYLADGETEQAADQLSPDDLTRCLAVYAEGAGE